MYCIALLDTPNPRTSGNHWLSFIVTLGLQNIESICLRVRNLFSSIALHSQKDILMTLASLDL